MISNTWALTPLHMVYQRPCVMRQVSLSVCTTQQSFSFSGTTTVIDIGKPTTNMASRLPVYNFNNQAKLLTSSLQLLDCSQCCAMFHFRSLLRAYGSLPSTSLTAFRRRLKSELLLWCFDPDCVWQFCSAMLDSKCIIFIVKCPCRTRIYDTLIIFVNNNNNMR